MNRWCNLCNCWCDDVEEVTDEELGCDYDCSDCKECQVIEG